MSSVKRIRAVANACRVMETIADGQPIGVSEIARRTDIDKSAVHRIALTLRDAGWIMQDPRTTPRWQVSRRLADIARGSVPHSLATIAHPVMETLRQETGETILLATLTGDGLLVHDVAESEQPVRLSTQPGTQLPVAESAAGRAIAAHLTPDELERLRLHHPAIDDEVLADVRRRGWSQNDGEVDPSARTVGAPVLDEVGRPMGALVICAPAFRLPRSKVPELGRRCAAAAAAVTGAFVQVGEVAGS